jgi:hypothetical protein
MLFPLCLFQDILKIFEVVTGNQYRFLFSAPRGTALKMKEEIEKEDLSPQVVSTTE